MDIGQRCLDTLRENDLNMQMRQCADWGQEGFVDVQSSMVEGLSYVWASQPEANAKSRTDGVRACAAASKTKVSANSLLLTRPRGWARQAFFDATAYFDSLSAPVSIFAILLTMLMDRAWMSRCACTPTLVCGDWGSAIVGDGSRGDAVASLRDRIGRY